MIILLKSCLIYYLIHLVKMSKVLAFFPKTPIQITKAACISLCIVSLLGE